MIHRIFTGRSCFCIVLLGCLAGCNTPTEPGPAPPPIAVPTPDSPTMTPAATLTPLRPTLPTPGGTAITDDSTTDLRWQPPEPLKDAPLLPIQDTRDSLLTWSEQHPVPGSWLLKLSTGGDLLVEEPQADRAQHWKTTQYHLQAAPFAQLQAQIATVDFFALEDAYGDTRSRSVPKISLFYTRAEQSKVVRIGGTPALPAPLQALIRSLRDLEEHPDSRGAVVSPPPVWIIYDLHGARRTYHLEIDSRNGLRYWPEGIADPVAYLTLEDQRTLTRLLTALQPLGPQQQYQEFTDAHTNPALEQTGTVTVFHGGQPVQVLTAHSGAQVPPEFQALLAWLALIYDDYAGSAR